MNHFVSDRQLSGVELMRKRVHAALNPEGTLDSIEKNTTRAMIVLIVLSALSAILDSSEVCRGLCGGLLAMVELVTTIAFSVEYVLRLWSCTSDARYASVFIGRLRFVMTPMALVDLAAVLPYYLSAGGTSSLLVLRCLRLVRLLRVMKLLHYSPTLRLFTGVLRKRANEIGVALFLNLILVVVAASLIYVAENGHQPAVFSSIPASMWWAIITLTTVGYGDAYPVTVLGKMLTAGVAILGVGLFALPAALIASGFIEETLRKPTPPILCPHCGCTADEAA